MKSTKVTNWLIVIFGIITIFLLLVVIGDLKEEEGNKEVSEVTQDNGDDTDNETIANNWKTDIKDWEFKTESGETVKYHTPDGFYSLTDQYLDNLSSYYSKDSIKSDSMIVVGDAISPYDSKIVINANKLSDTLNMLKQLYGDDFKDEDMQDAEAYTYMKTGKLPDKLPLNYKIEEVDTYKVDGTEYVAYEVNYDTEYETEQDEDTKESKKETVHTQQISCYSKTEDSVEIIVYQSEFNREESLSALKEFLGVKE